jgi:UDP-N-acetylmuramate dehydrogenase
MDLKEDFPIKGKTTMRIGGAVRKYAMLQSQADCEEAVRKAAEWKLPLIVLGSGSNTVFADGTVEAFAVQIGNTKTEVAGNRITVGGGKNLAMLINELAAKDLDLSALTGIPGTVGGALFGNAGQGPKGIWIDTYVSAVTVLIDGAWKTLTKEECRFRYRESAFKDHASPCIIWEAVLDVPSRPGAEVKANV